MDLVHQMPKSIPRGQETNCLCKGFTHYDATLPIKLLANVSAYCVGSMILHRMPDGTERPIAFAFYTLTKTKKNYAQLVKETLSLVYGVKKFHWYLFGWKFTLLTDHQPLTHIFHVNKGIPSLAEAWLQRWALLFSAYDYGINCKHSKDYGNVDGLWRLPLTSNEPAVG